MTLEAVVFDIGNVLVRWQPEEFYDREIGVDRRQALFKAVDLHEMNARVDAGAPFRETIYATAAAHPLWADEIRAWHDRWIEIAVPEIPQTARLAERLKAEGMKIFVLSNISAACFRLLADRNPVFGTFDQVYLSGRLGVNKPDPAIYAALEETSGVPPQALYFIDDKPENIAAARARGWQGHIYGDYPALETDLVAAGVLPRAGV